MRSTIDIMPESPTTIRLTRDINTAVREFANEMGISFNAALKVLVAEALTARGKHPGIRKNTG
jgi:hypothetical protein